MPTTDPVEEARLLRQRAKYFEPDSSSHQEPSFSSGFSQSSQDLYVSATLATAMQPAPCNAGHYNINDSNSD